MKKLLTAALLLSIGLAWADDAAFRFYFDLAPRSIEELDEITKSLVPDANTRSSKAPIVVITPPTQRRRVRLAPPNR